MVALDLGCCRCCLCTVECGRVEPFSWSVGGNIVSALIVGCSTPVYVCELYGNCMLLLFSLSLDVL